MHHLDNNQVNIILNLCKKKIKKNSKLLTEDRLIKDQNFIAKFLISRDRGYSERTRKEEYINLLKTHFKNLLNKNYLSKIYTVYLVHNSICKK